jgi:hypothetical protein
MTNDKRSSKHKWRCRVLNSFGFAFLCLRAFAHDPYEITSTLSLYSNRCELNVELEFRAGMQLAGNNGFETADPAALFESAHPALTNSAAQFFRLSADGTELKPQRADVTLGVENHIRFKISYPAIPTAPLSLDAPGLKSLSNDGPYGASLTVLDMQNKKVIAQSVLFAASPVLSLNPGSVGVSPASATQSNATAPIRLDRSSLLPDSRTTQPLPASIPSNATPQFTAILVAFIAFALLCALTWLRLQARRKERSSC